jgi:predicted DNA-binding ribbon-helix-helix protein
MTANSSLERARVDVELSHSELWFRYFELGGMSTALELEAYLYDALAPTEHDRNLIAVALNERYSELGGDHPIPYTDDEQQHEPTA